MVLVHGLFCVPGKGMAWALLLDKVHVLVWPEKREDKQMMKKNDNYWRHLIDIVEQLILIIFNLQWPQA